MAELGFKPDVSVFVASIRSHFPAALKSPFRKDGGPERPPRDGGVGFRLIWPDGEEVGRRQRPDAAAISGQMKPDPFSA